MKLYNILIFRLVFVLNKHGMKMPVLPNTHFGPQFSISQHSFWLFEQRNLPRFFVWHTVLDGHFQMLHVFVQWTMLSDKQSEHSFSPTTF